MTLEEYIEVLEKPTFKIEVDTSELLGMLEELRDARELIKRLTQYIECHIDRRR